MSEPDVPLAAEFEPPTREAWLTLVEKVLKGADFDKRLVSRTADGLALQPLVHPQRRAHGGAPAGRTGWFPGGWDVRQRHTETDPKAANAAILEDLEGGAHLSAAADPGARAGGPLLCAPSRWRGAQGRLPQCLHHRAGRAREHAGRRRQPDRRSGAARHQRERPARRLQLRSAGRAGQHRHALLSGRSLVRDRRQARRRLPHHVERRALLADGRPYHEAGASEAQELAAMLATLVAYLRACESGGARPRMALGQDRARRWRPMPTCS